MYVWQHLLLSPAQGAQRVAYALGRGAGGAHRPRGAAGGYRALLPAPATILTSMFLHGGFWHLAGNMLYLWIFGNNIEDAMGHVRFFIFYVLCGIAAVFAQVLPNPGSIVPMVGASGAISGVLGAYMLLYPRARVLLGLPLGFLIVQLGRFPAIWVLAAWFVMQLVMGSIAAARPPGDRRRHRLRRAHRRIHRRSRCSSHFSNVATCRCGGVTETLLHSARVARPESLGLASRGVDWPSRLTRNLIRRTARLSYVSSRAPRPTSPPSSAAHSRAPSTNPCRFAASPTTRACSAACGSPPR